MPEKIKTLYSNLIQEGYDLPNYDQFLLDMSDSNKRKKFHSSLIEEGYDLPDFNTFTIDMGIGEKKKPTSVGLPRAFQPFQEGVGQSVKMPSPSTSTSTSTKTPTTTTPKAEKPDASLLKSYEAKLKEKKELLAPFESKAKELDARLEEYNKIAKNNNNQLPPKQYAEYKSIADERNALTEQYKKFYSEYTQLADKYNVEFKNYNAKIGEFNKGIEALNAQAKKAQEAESKRKFDELQKLGRNPAQRIKLYSESARYIQSRIPDLVEKFNLAEQSGNVEEAQMLQKLINADSEKLKTYEKLIQGQKMLAAMDEKSSATIGLMNLGGYLASGVNFLEELNAQIISDITGFKLSDESIKEIKQINEKIGTVRPSDAIAKLGKEMLTKAESETELKRVNMPYEGAVWEALKNGDLKSATSNAASGFVQSLPTSLLMFNPITGSLVSSGMAQQSVDEARKENGSVTTTDYLAGIIKAGSEYAFENMFGTGKALKELIKKLGNESAKLAIEETLKVGIRDWAKKVGVNILEESLSEGATQISQNLVDISMGKNIGIFDNVPDATLIGMFGGMTQGTAITTISHIIDRNKAKDFQSRKEQALQLQEQALEAPSEVVAEAIENKAAKINAEADAIAEEQNEISSNASPEIIDEIDLVNAELDELEAALPESPPEVQEAIQSEIQEKEKKLKELSKEARISALERLKVAEEEISMPSVEFETPSIKLSVKENPYKESLRKLGYQDSDIDKMTMEQMQEIATNKTEAPIVESSSKVDVVKENKRQERIAEINKELDEEITPQEPKIQEDEKITAKEENVEPMLEGVQPNRDEVKGGEASAELYSDQKGKTQEITPPTKENLKGEKVETQSQEGVEAVKSPVFNDKNLTNEEEVKPTENPALKDVESTAKALQKEDVGKIEKIAGVKKDKFGFVKYKPNENDEIEQLSKEIPKKTVWLARSKNTGFDVDVSEKLEYKNGKWNVGVNEFDTPYDAAWFLRKNQMAIVGENKPTKEQGVKVYDKEYGYGSEKIGDLSKRVEANKISEAYHKAKEDGSNPELVQAVEQLLTNKPQEDAIKSGEIEQSSESERKGVTEQKQGEQENRVNQEEPITKGQASPSGSDFVSEGGKGKEVKAKPKKKKIGSNKAINKLQPETKRDYIALALANTYISTSSFNRANDRNNLKVGPKKFPSVRMNYLRKNGMSIYEFVDNLMRDKVAFPFEMTEERLIEEVTGFMLDNPNGVNSYAVEMLNVPDPEQEYYDRQLASYEQQLAEEKLLEDAIFEELELSWDKIEEDVDALTEEQIAEIEQLMASDEIDLIEQIIENNNENIGTKERENQGLPKGESIRKTDKGKEVGNVKEEVVSSTDKMFSASSRFKPKELIVFDKPIIGPNGNKLVSYQWAYEWTMLPNREGELVDKRVSDWSQAETSAETGRGLVHKFNVERKDGVLVTVSSETVPSLLGYVEPSQMKNFPSLVSSVKTLAKQRMQLAILKAQQAEYDKIKNEVNRLPKPKIVPAEISDLPKITQSIAKRDSEFFNDKTYWKTEGDTKIIYPQQNKYTYPDNITKEQLLGLWETAEIEKRGGVKPKGLYDLERKIERQEKKVEQITGSKTTINQENLSTSKQTLEERVKESKSNLDKALRTLNKTKKALEEAAAESQKDIFGRSKQEEKLFSQDLKKLNSDVKEKELAYNKASNEYDKAKLTLDSYVPENQSKIDFDSAISFLENLKADTKGKMNAFGIAPAVWNAAIDTIILGVKAGRVISEVVQEAIDYINANHGKFDEKAFKDMLVEGGVVTEDELVVEGEPTDEAEGEPKKDTERKPKQGSTPNSRVRSHYTTVTDNKTLSNITDELDSLEYEYEVKPEKSDKEKAIAYIEKYGVEESYQNVIDNTYNEELAGSEANALASLVYGALSKAMALAIKEGDMAAADLIKERSKELIKKISERGTDAGRFVNSFKYFALDFSNPETAAYNLQKEVEEINKKTREKSSNISNANNVAKDIAKEVKKGKAKVVSEVVKDIDEMLYGTITKGKKGLTPEQKAKVKSVFEAFKVNKDGKVQSSVVPIKEIIAAIVTPEKYNQFIDKVADAVAEGVSLSVAMTRVSAEFIKNKLATPKEMAAARKALTEQVNGIKTKKPLTEKQIERRKASEELKAATERFNALNELEKFREKQEKRVEDLRKKDAQKVLDEVEKLELQRSRKLAKEAASLEEELRKEKQRIADLKAKEEITRKEKLEKLALQRAQKEAKEAKDLEEEIRKENKRIADLRAKEEIERREKIEKLELQRAQERLKQIERTIRDLVLGIPKTDEELVNEIITEYLSLEGDVKTNNEKLVKLVKDNIEGLTDSEARVIATKIAKGVAEKIKKKLETKFGSALSKEEQEQKKVSATPKTKEDILDQLVKASNLGVASPQLIMDFFQNKYGIQNLSAEDVNGIIELSKALANAPTKNRKGVILAEIQKVIDSKKKRTLAELLQNLWYARVLSPVLTGVLGTGDVNLAYNILAVKLNMIEAPLTASINSMKYIVKDIKGNIGDKRKVGESIKQNLLGLLTDSLSASLAPFVQRVNYDADANLFKTIIKNPTLLRESITYFTEALSNGLAFKKDTENPFTATGASTFNISNYLKYFEDARKGDKKAKAIIGMAVNKYVNSVTNMLGGQDLAFGTMVGRGYMSTLVREKLYKEGLRGKELNSKVLETILDTKIQGELAAEKALSYRMNFDISIDLQMDNDGNTYYIIKDKGKVYKERQGIRLVEKRFDSKDEAIDYAREVVAPKSNTFKLDVINILNERLGEDVLKNMNRISSNDLLSAQAEGSARLVFSMATFIIDNLNKLSDFFNDMSKNLDTYDWKDILGMAKEKDIDAVKGIIRKVLKYITKTISILVRSTANLLAFLRVGLNSVRNQSSYIFPIGVLRYFASYFTDDKGKTRSLLSTMSYEMSDTEKSKILAKAMIGAYTFSATAYLSTFLTANADDDDEDKETLEEREKARELFRSWYKEKTKEDLPRNIDDFYFKLTKGDVIGSLNWLTPEEYKFYKKTGLFPENSIFLGFDSKGKPIFESILNDPSYAMAVSASTYKLIQAFGDEEQKEMAKINAAITPFYSWKDMTIGQGGISVLLGNKKPQEKMETIVQVSVLDNLEVLSPRIIPVTLQYFYPEARRTDNLFEAIERQESIVKGSGQFFIQRVFPLTAGWYQSTQAPKMYGMLGETIVRVPAEKQGLFSAYYAKLLRESLSEDDSDLSKAISKKLNEWYNTNQNIDESKIYIWMAANGKRTSFKPPVEQAIVNGDGEIEKLTMSQKEKYEPKAALKSKEFLLKNLYKLQILREVGGETTEDKEKAFSTEIQKIFKQNFLNEYYLGEKSFGDKTAEMVSASVNNMQAKLDEKVNSAIIEYIKRTEKNKDIKITPEEEEMASKGYTAEQYLAFIKDEEDKMGKLERARLVGILTQEQFMKSLEMLGKFKSKSGLDDYLKNNKPF